MILRRFATIVSRNIAAPGRPPHYRKFYEDVDYHDGDLPEGESGIGWAAPVYERRPVGSRVEIEIRSFDDQYAYPVGIARDDDNA